MNIKEKLKTDKIRKGLHILIIVAIVIAACGAIKGNYIETGNVIGDNTIETEAPFSDHKYIISAFMARAEKFGFCNEYIEENSTTKKISFNIKTEDEFTNPKLVLAMPENDITSYTITCTLRKTESISNLNPNYGIGSDINRGYESKNKAAVEMMKVWNTAFLSALDIEGKLNGAQISCISELIDEAYSNKNSQTGETNGYSTDVTFEDGKTENTIIVSVSK